MHNIEGRRVFDRVFWFVGGKSCFLSQCVLVNSGDGFWATLVSNNREGTEETTRDIVNGYEGIGSDLGQDNATCLSGAV
jgi:hypothetical protein